jgi:hypothetical protein
VPDRDGVTLETPFVGPGMRGRERLRYFPCRLSLVPVLLRDALRIITRVAHPRVRVELREAGRALGFGSEARRPKVPVRTDFCICRPRAHCGVLGE